MPDDEARKREQAKAISDGHARRQRPMVDDQQPNSIDIDESNPPARDADDIRRRPGQVLSNEGSQVFPPQPDVTLDPRAAHAAIRENPPGPARGMAGESAPGEPSLAEVYALNPSLAPTAKGTPAQAEEPGGDLPRREPPEAADQH